MSRKKRDRPIMLSRVARGLRTLLRHGELLLVATVIAALVLGGSYWGWQLLRQRSLQVSEYRLDPGKISVNTPPSWIDLVALKAEVLRDASLDQPISILDENLSERIGLAFGAHPWVAEVERVEKFHPARVEVQLVYRRPVAAIAIEHELFPVDPDGVLLPRANFSLTDLASFPRVRGDHVNAANAPGRPWGDIRVIAAARIAAEFGAQWNELDLAEIIPGISPVNGERDVYAFTIVTNSGTEIRWGRQYIYENALEPTATEKRRRLEQYAQQHGTLDGVSFPRASVPRTAKGPQEIPRSN